MRCLSARWTTRSSTTPKAGSRRRTMTTDSAAVAPFLETLEPIVTDVILPRAAEIDREARFPREAITALGEAGLLGLISAKEVGGMGLGLDEATRVVERIARDCPATAMVVTMHYAGTT